MFVDINKTEIQKTGALGEDLAVKYLENKGYFVIRRNYLKKYGEIDIIAKNKDLIHFIEVKTVTVPSGLNSGNDFHRPEDNVHKQKLLRLSRTIQAYQIENMKEGEDWQFDVVTVLLDKINKTAKINLIEDIVL